MFSSLVLVLASCLALPTTLPPLGGGSSWTKLPSGIATNLYNFDFVSDSEGWAVGWSVGAGNAVILSTTDGGRAWDVSLLLPDDLLFGITCTPEGHVLAVGQRGDGDDGLILTSTDKGATWTETVLPTTFGLYDVVALRGGRAFACGYDGAIFRSDDAGRTWTALDTGSSTVFRALSAVNRETVYAMGGSPFAGDNVWVTHDGGESWSLAKQFGGSLVFSDIHFTSELEGVIVGTGVFRTQNGGANWKKDMQLPPLGVLQRVNFHGAVGVAISSGGSTIRSLDSGLTWELLPSPAPSASILSCSPRGTGVVVSGTFADFYYWVPDGAGGDR